MAIVTLYQAAPPTTFEIEPTATLTVEGPKTGKTKKKAAIAKKGRFNILRIYRKNNKVKECNIITSDMKYMDKKYGLGKTKNICGKKDGRKIKTQKLKLK